MIFKILTKILLKNKEYFIKAIKLRDKTLIFSIEEYKPLQDVLKKQEVL